MSSLSDPKPPPAPLVSDVSSAPDVSADHCKADPASYLGDAAYSHSMSLPSDDLEEPWDKFARKLCDRDRDTAKAWKEEIDTLLLLALLFSTILAVFNVGLYILNQSDSVANNNTQALLQIVSILSNTSVPLGLVTTPALASTRSPQSVLIHALTASSLIIGLSTAFIGTMIRQWLDFFISPHSDNGERSVYIHCLRWDIGLMAWHVPTLLMALSALLQLAMALFLGGLFVFLWTFNTVVGAVATIPLLCLYVFWLLTTLAPAFYPLCPYKSPQALFFVWFIRRVEIMVATLTHAASNNNTFGFSPTKRNSERRSPDDSLGHGHLYRIASHLRLILTSFIATQPGRAFSPRGPDVTWASLELDTMSEDGCLRKTSTCLKEHVFALGHTLLADEALLHKVVPPCSQPTTPVLIRDIDTSWADPDLREGIRRPMYKLRCQSIRSSLISLRRLRFLLDCRRPISQKTYSVIAYSAATLLQKMSLGVPWDDSDKLVKEVQEEVQEEVWMIMPHICAGGPNPMANVLHYLAERASALASRPQPEPGESSAPQSELALELSAGPSHVGYPPSPAAPLSEADALRPGMNTTKLFVDSILGYRDLPRIFKQGPFNLVDKDMDGRYAAEIITHIADVTLDKRPVPFRDPEDVPRHRDAACLAMLFIISIPENLYSRQQLLLLVTNMQYCYDRLPTDGAASYDYLATLLIRGYMILRSESSVDAGRETGRETRRDVA